MKSIDKRAEEYNQLYHKQYGVFLSSIEAKQHVLMLANIVHRVYVPAPPSINLTTINEITYEKSSSKLN